MKSDANSDSTLQDELDAILLNLSSGQFEKVLIEANRILPSTRERLDRATCEFAIGAALKELGERDKAISHFLEAEISFPTNQPFLLGHAQFEISLIQYQNGLNVSALAFSEKAIINFSLLEEQAGTAEMKMECAKLRDQILSELKNL